MGWALITSRQKVTYAALRCSNIACRYMSSSVRCVVGCRRTIFSRLCTTSALRHETRRVRHLFHVYVYIHTYIYTTIYYVCVKRYQLKSLLVKNIYIQVYLSFFYSRMCVCARVDEHYHTHMKYNVYRNRILLLMYAYVTSGFKRHVRIIGATRPNDAHLTGIHMPTQGVANFDRA